MTTSAREFVVRRAGRRLGAVAGALLAASTVYLGWLLFGYVFKAGTIRRHHVESASYVFAAVWLLTAVTRSAWRLPASVRRGPTRPWALLALFAASPLLYGSTIPLGLFSDDFVLVHRALSHEWTGQSEFVRPLPLVVWSLLLAITTDPAVLHLLSIVLHGFNAVLVCWLALRLGLPSSGAAAAGVLFVAFPSSVEAVVWPSAVHDLLVATCALVFILLAGRRRSWRGLVAAVLVLVAALLSKESAIAIPALAAAMWVRPGTLRSNDAWPVILLGLVVCVGYVLVRTTLLPVQESFAQYPTRYMLKELVARPIGTLTIPWTSAVVDSWPVIPFSWAMGSSAAAAAYAWSTAKALPVGAAVRCLAAVFVAVLPVYSMLFITPDLENGRYLYLATAFWAICLVGFVTSSDGLGRVRLVVIGVAILTAASGVQLHLMAWREAAGIRTRVLTAAEATLRSAQCRPVSFAGAPDSVRGAYIFRNGLSEAIAFHTGAVPVPPGSGCSFVWNGVEFQRSTSLPGPVQASFAP